MAVDPDEVAALCYRRFAELPGRGKPEPGREWTLMAAVVQLRPGLDGVEMEVVSMGTGTKCIGRSAMSPNGDVINDSHAEVLARRGCVRYLIHQLRQVINGGSSVVFHQKDENGRWSLKPGVSFIFFTSHTPCGDASIVPMTQPCPPILNRPDGDPPPQPCPPVPNMKRLQGSDGDPPPQPKRTRVKVEDRTDPVNPEPPPGADVHRTGAKCVSGGPTDSLGPGSEYHSTGVLRVKPGRGQPTLSLSCSDKLARWGVVGFQGALLAHYLQEALYFSCVVVGRCPYSAPAMHRALVQRCSHVSGLPVGFSVSPPVLVQSSLEFPFNQTQTELQHQDGQGSISPCGAAISWCHVTEQPLDVTANGYKHGVTKKLLGTAKARSLVCKLELFGSFLSLISATDTSALPPSLRGAELVTYWDYKRASQRYQQAWDQLQCQAFPLWPRSDRKLLHFHPVHTG